MRGLNWKIGDVEIFQIVELGNVGRNIQSMLTDATPLNLKKTPGLYPQFIDNEGNLFANVQSFLIKTANANILIDTCNGNEKFRESIPEWGNLKTDYLDRIKEIGINETDIDLVICTHLHFDHVGWNTKLVDNIWKPTFINADYLFVKDEYDYWKSKPDNEIDDDFAAFDDSITPVVNAGLAKFVDKNQIIDHNITLTSTPGHTPGHVSILIKSQGESVLLSGDLFYHPCQITNPNWIGSSDSDPQRAIISRLRILKEITNTDTFLLGSHFSNPVSGKVKTRNKIYFFEI